jgi:hypothetical protein
VRGELVSSEKRVILTHNECIVLNRLLTETLLPAHVISFVLVHNVGDMCSVRMKKFSGME